MTLDELRLYVRHLKKRSDELLALLMEQWDREPKLLERLPEDEFIFDVEDASVQPSSHTREAAVYFIVNAGLIKIGWTLNLVGRVRDLQAMSGAPIQLLGYICIAPAKAIALERAFHQQFATVRRHGEWFELSTKQAIELVRESGGVLTEDI